MFTWFALKSILFYQKFISPYKGFNCAHGVLTGEITCSNYGKKAIKRFGLVTGLKLLNRRFYDCSWCNEKLKNKNKLISAETTAYKPNKSGYLNRYQSGFVDADCGACDSMDCNGCDMPDLGNCIPDASDCVPNFSHMDCFPSISESCFLDGCNIADPLFDTCLIVNITDTMCDSACYCVPDGCGGRRYNEQFKTRRFYRNTKKYSHINKQICNREVCETNSDEWCDSCPERPKNLGESCHD